MDDGSSTVSRLLNSAQTLYALHGLPYMTLQALTEPLQLHPNAVQGFFKNREALLAALYIRVLRPISNERTSLLRHAQLSCEQPLSAAQIACCLVLPYLREIICRDDSEIFQFVLRVSCELDPQARLILDKQFLHDDKPFREAFASVTKFKRDGAAELLASIFLSDRAGSVISTNLLIACRDAVVKQRYSHVQTLQFVGRIAQAAFCGGKDHSELEGDIGNLLAVLQHTQTVQATLICERFISFGGSK